MLLGRYAPYQYLIMNPMGLLETIIKGKRSHRLNYYNRSLDSITKFLKLQGYNVCINDKAREMYDPAKKNILIAAESPEYVEYLKWLDEEMIFEAEISLWIWRSISNTAKTNWFP